MLEIQPDELKNAVITDVEYHQDTGELLTLWVRMNDKRLVKIIPVDFVMKLHSCPYDEEQHGNSKWVVTEKVPNGEFIPIESSLFGAIITSVGDIERRETGMLYMQLPDKRFISIHALAYKMIAVELPPSLIEKYGGINYTSDLIRSRIQTPGNLMEVLDHDAKAFTKDGSLEWINRNKHMNDYDGEFETNEHNQKLVDAAVVGFLNYVASQYCMDYGMYTRDLRE